jgi:hypothetical protein
VHPVTQAEVIEEGEEDLILYNGLVETGLSYFINVACYDYKI